MARAESNPTENEGSRTPGKLKRALGIAFILGVELAVLFVVCEIVARIFLPAGHNFLHPQMLTRPHPVLIYEHVPNHRLV